MTLLLLLITLDFRTWQSGDYRCDARFVSCEQNQVELIRQDNHKSITIKRQLLSDNDQAYVEMVESLTTSRRWVINGRNHTATYIDSYQDMFTLRNFAVLKTRQGNVHVHMEYLLPKDRQLINWFEQSRIKTRAQQHIDWAKQQ